MITPAQLRRMGEAQIETADKNALADIQGIVIDPELPLARRLDACVSQVWNPYLFRCGDISIKLCYAEEGGTLDDALAAYLLRLKNGRPQQEGVSHGADIPAR